MARTRTLTNLIADVRLRADIVDSNVLTDADITRFLNESITDLYDLLILHQGQEFFLKTSTLNTVNGTDTYNLPSDFFLLRGVDIDFGGGSPWPIRPYSFADRYYGRSSNGTGVTGWSYTGDVFYRTYGTADVDPANGFSYKMRFTPVPDGVHEVTMWYIPHAPEMVNGTDIWDGFNGWEEYAVVDSAIKCVEKQELDTAALQVRLVRLTKRIEALANHRDAGFPERVQIVEY